MTARELIDKLEKLIDEFGDLPVMLNEGYTPASEPWFCEAPNETNCFALS